MTNPTPEKPERTKIELRALEIWEELSKGKPPKEPLRYRGGALDPSGRCMQQAQQEILERKYL